MSAAACAKKILCDELAKTVLNELIKEIEKPNQDTNQAIKRSEFILDSAKNIYIKVSEIK